MLSSSIPSKFQPLNTLTPQVLPFISLYNYGGVANIYSFKQVTQTLFEDVHNFWVFNGISNEKIYGFMNSRACFHHYVFNSLLYTGSLVSLGKHVMPMKFLGTQSVADDQCKHIELVKNRNSRNYFQAMAFVNAISGKAFARTLFNFTCFEHLC